MPAASDGPSELAQAIQQLGSGGRKVFTGAKLPPLPPNVFKRWVPERAEDAPHEKYAYFPMVLVK